MASKQSADGKVEAASSAVALEGLKGVSGAGGQEAAAGAEVWGDGRYVKPDHPGQDVGSGAHSSGPEGPGAPSRKESPVPFRARTRSFRRAE